MSKTIYIGGRLESKEKGNVVTGANAILDDTKGKKQNVINKETDDELARLEQSKQDNLTFDNAPTEDSTNPVTSGGVYTAEKALSDAIEAILLLIPSAATALNKLVDTNTMNSSISTATATFRGTYNAVSDLGLTYQATHAQIEAALDALGLTADNNDYAFVQVPVSDQSQDIAKTERYKNNGTNWQYEYDLNTSGFTAAQWGAINSTITLALVQKLAALPTNAELLQSLGLKQDVLTFDNAPTTDSNNPVKSGGIKSAIDTAVGDEVTARENADAALGGLIGDEQTRAEGVEGGLNTRLEAVEGSVTTIQGVIPSGATSSNKLVDNNSMTTYISTIIDNIDATFNVTSTDGHVTLAITQVNGVITSVQLTTSDIASAAALNLKASQADLTALAGRVTTAEGNLTALAGRVTTAEGNITSLTGRVSTNETDIANLQQLYNNLQQSKPVPVTSLPSSGQQQGVIYRLAGTTSYSDYMWNGSTWVLMATYNNAIDDAPTAGSNNLVKSGGVKEEITRLNDKTDVIACIGNINNGFKISYVTGASNSVVFNCNSFTLSPVKEDGGNKWYGFPAQTDVTIPNTNCLVFNVSTHVTTVKSVNSINNINEILIVINLYGRLYSPIPQLNEQLSILQPSIKRTDCIATTERNFSLSVTQDENNAIVNMSGVTLTGIINRYNYTILPAIQNLTINNTDCLVFYNNYDDGTASAIGITDIVNLTEVKPYHTILFICLKGKLYSPIPQLNDKLYEIYHPTTELPAYTDVYLTPDVSTPNLIANTVRSILDATALKRYRVYLAAGTYNEIDIITKDYVDIIGVKPDNTIIFTDGHATYNSPADYTFSDYSNTPVNEIPEAYKHTLWHVSNSKVSNVTIKAIHCKYPVHQDGDGNNLNAVIENCVIVDSGCSTGVLGVGIRNTQKFSYINTTFIVDVNNVDNSGTFSFNLHNWNNKSSNAEMLFESCSFFNCKDIIFTELGSTQNDIVKFASCYTDNNMVIRYDATKDNYLIDGQHVQDIEDVPYCFSVNTSGSNIPIIRTNNRKKYNMNTVGEYVQSRKASTQINFGYAVTIDANGEIILLNNESANFMTAMCNSENNQILVNNGKVHYVKAILDTYTVGDNLTVLNGVFQKTLSGGIAKVKYFFDNNTDIYLEIEKL